MGNLVCRFQGDYLEFPRAKFQVFCGPPSALAASFFQGRTQISDMVGMSSSRPVY